MNFPDKVTFRLIDGKTKKSIKNIALLLILYAHKKNNYSIEAKISNDKGEVVFTKEDCLKGIESSRRFYLMDYASSMEECLSYVSVEVLSKNAIAFVLKNRREYKKIYQDYWDCSEEFLKALEVTGNSQYVSKIYDFSEADLWKGKVLEVELEKR